MMYAVYRHYGNEVFSGENLLFVTASKQVAEDAVALAQLEQEAAFAIPYPSQEPISGSAAQWLAQNAAHNEKVAEYYKNVATILTVDPEGIDDDFSYYFEEVEVR
jgi:hypothetical protein